MLAEEPIANVKSEGKEAFANGDYSYAIHCYLRVCLRSITHDVLVGVIQNVVR